MDGESGRNELLRGPFALFGVRISAKLVRDLAKHRRSLSSRRKPDLGAEGKIKSADNNPHHFYHLHTHRHLSAASGIRPLSASFE